jgi:outer membrane protein OmpA-like peptidoglycan-associated protein
MKLIFALIFSVFLTSFSSWTQTNFSGIWQGISIRDGYKNDQAVLFFANFQITDQKVNGKTREELYNTDFFAVKQIKGTIKGKEINFSQFVIEKKKNAPNQNWCNVDATLSYNDSTGYLEGRYKSSNCRSNTGKIILFRTTLPFSATETSMLTHSWLNRFLIDLSKGYNAPEKRDKERTNFKFQPIYFDHDKAEIRPEYFDFLNRMVRVVDGHSDLRIKVTGHTDADGSDEYNFELSKKRAQILIDYFVSKGLNKDRIEIDFKGEKSPIDNNNTPEGKQHNRRVDFSFI